MKTRHVLLLVVVMEVVVVVFKVCFVPSDSKINKQQTSSMLTSLANGLVIKEIESRSC